MNQRYYCFYLKMDLNCFTFKLQIEILNIQTNKLMHNPIEAFLPHDQANLVLAMLVSIPLSFILSLIYNRYLLLALSMTLTIGFQSLLFPDQRWFLWGQQQLVYLIIVVAPRKYVGHIILFESFLALSLIQLRRIFVTYGDNRVDVTGIFMMQLFNYIGLGYNYQNGEKSEDKLIPDQIKRRVVERPEYLTYVGYVNFLPACLVGPSYQYTDFQDYLHRRRDYVSIPNTIVASIKEFIVFAFSMGVHLATSYFNVERVSSAQFLDYSLAYKLLYSIIFIIHIEFKYITAWSLGMVSMRASGITYNPSKNIVEKDNSITYDFGKVEVTNMTKFYFAPSIKVKADSWNMSIQTALRRYIYENLYNPANYSDEKVKKSKQFQAQLATVVVSALWHGLYPGYYISFVHWILYVQIMQQVFRLKKIKESSVGKLYSKYESILNIIENLTSTFVLCYFGMAFHLLTWGRVWAYLEMTYFVPYIILYTTFYLVTKVRILSGGSRGPSKAVQDKKD